MMGLDVRFWFMSATPSRRRTSCVPKESILCDRSSLLYLFWVGGASCGRRMIMRHLYHESKRRFRLSVAVLCTNRQRTYVRTYSSSSAEHDFIAMRACLCSL